MNDRMKTTEKRCWTWKEVKESLPYSNAGLVSMSTVYPAGDGTVPWQVILWKKPGGGEFVVHYARYREEGDVSLDTGMYCQGILAAAEEFTRRCDLHGLKEWTEH